MKTLRDLHVLQLEDRERYSEYARISSCPFNGWWVQFPYFWSYSLAGKRQSLWAVLDGLFAPFIFSGRYLSLLTIPFGEGGPEKYHHVLEQCFNLCSRQNGINQDMTHARWVTEDQVRFLKQSENFEKFFQAEKLTLGPEYHFSIESLLSLDGKDFDGVRRKRNKFLKKNPDILIREYLPADEPEALKLHAKWSDDARTRYSDIFDETYYPAFLKKHENFDHIILVAVHNGSIVGLIAGSITPDGQSYCYLRKALLEYEGLSETLLLSLVRAIHEKNDRVRFLNDGGTGQKPGMMSFKQRFRPVKLVNRYRVDMNAPHILRKTAYRGPSIAGYHPSARLVIENNNTDMFTEVSAHELDHCNSLLARAFNSDAEGMDWKLEKSPALLLAQVAVLVQQASRHPVTSYSARQITPAQTEICFELLRPDLLKPLVECITAFWRSGLLGFDPCIFVDQYLARRESLGFTLQEYIVWNRIRTAQRLGIAARPDEGFRVWLGRGSERRLTSLGYTQNTPRLAKTIAGDKSLSHSYLLKKGLPLPQQKVAGNEKAALRAARQIGYPVVVKPRQGNKGEGVSVNLASEKDISRAYHEARQIDRTVVVESFVDGDDFRLLVISGRFIAAVKRIPAHVTGDGCQTIRDLMESTNRKERRDGLFLYPLKNDGAIRRILRDQGFSPESVPANGQHVLLRRAANVSLGGTIEDVTDLVHPDNRAAAISAAETCLLDVAGVDFKTPDIARSWRKGYGRIIEINSGPGVELHMEPTIGSPREVSHHLLRCHFPSRRKEPQPLVAISGRYGKESVANFCAAIWSRMGIKPALLFKDRLISGTRTLPIAKSLHERMDILERHTEYDAAAMTVSMETILKEGLCSDNFSCAVITDDLVDEKPGVRYHDPLVTDRGCRLLVDMATHGVVIDGTSRRFSDIVHHLPASHIIMVCPDPYHSLPLPVQKHLDRGGRAIGIRKLGQEPEMLTWLEACAETPLSPISSVAPGRVKSLLMAVAATIATSAPQKKLPGFLHAYTNIGTLSPASSLVTDRCPERGIRAACADPGDKKAMREFFSSGWTGGTIYLVASNRTGMKKEWEQWLLALAALDVRYMLENGPGSPPGPVKAQLFDTLEEAWKLAIHLAGEDDTILLLTQAHPMRRSFFRYFQAGPETPASCRLETGWSAEKLAEIFQGTWISGRHSGWSAKRIGWGREMAGPDTVTILPGSYPELTADLAPMEQDLEQAFRAGALAAVSAVHASALPRWRRVLQTDDPYGGLLRLAYHSRRRLGGTVMAVAMGRSDCRQVLDLVAGYLSSHTDRDIYIAEPPEQRIDHVIATALALANTPPDHSLHVYPWEPADPFTGQLLSPDLVIFEEAGNHIQRPLNLLKCLKEKTSIFVLTDPDREDHWQKLAADSARTIRVVTSTEADPNFSTAWESILAVIP